MYLVGSRACCWNAYFENSCCRVGGRSHHLRLGSMNFGREEQQNPDLLFSLGGVGVWLDRIWTNRVRIRQNSDPTDWGSTQIGWSVWIGHGTPPERPF